MKKKLIGVFNPKIMTAEQIYRAVKKKTRLPNKQLKHVVSRQNKPRT